MTDLPAPVGVKVITYLSTARTFGRFGGSINTVSVPLRTAIAVFSATRAGTGGKFFTSVPRLRGTTKDGIVVAGTLTGTVTTVGKVVVVGGVELVSIVMNNELLTKLSFPAASVNVPPATDTDAVPEELAVGVNVAV